MNAPLAPEWWWSRFITVLRQLEWRDYRPRSPGLAHFHGRLSSLLEQELPCVPAQGLEILDACNRWYSGAYLLETVPCVP